MDELYRDYCRCLAAVDKSAGEILNGLEENRELDDTLIVYMGDNGHLWGEHGLADKRAMFDDVRKDPEQMDNLLSGVRIRLHSGAGWTIRFPRGT